MGSTDRKILRDKVYDIIRHRSILERLVPSKNDYEGLVEKHGTPEFEDKRKNNNYEEYELLKKSCPGEFPEASLR